VPARLQIRQLYFPLWKKVSSDGRERVSGISLSPEGFIELPLSPGKERVLLVFDGGWPESWGKVITVFSLIVIVSALGFFTIRREVV
jgi:hypothetical protein